MNKTGIVLTGLGMNRIVILQLSFVMVTMCVGIHEMAPENDC